MKTKTCTISLFGTEMEVEYIYGEGVDPIYYTPNGDGYPGHPPEVEIMSIECKDLCCVLDSLTSVEDVYMKIEEEVIEHELDTND